MIRVTVNRDGIDKGVENPITIERETPQGWVHVEDCAEAWLLGNARITFEPNFPLADGTRVWIEAQDTQVIRHA